MPSRCQCSKDAQGGTAPRDVHRAPADSVRANVPGRYAHHHSARGKMSTKAEAMLLFDLDNEGETILNYRERVRQCETLGEYAMAEEIREILRTQQEHQIDLATPLNKGVPVLKPL